MKEILFTLPEQGNHCGVLSSIYQALAAEMRRRQWKVDVISPSDENFLLKILTVGQKEEAILFFGHFFYDLRFSAQNHFRETSIAEMIRAPIGLEIGDHPFSRFMWERIQHTHENSFMFAPEPGYFEAALLLQPKLRNFRRIQFPISFAPVEQLTPFDQRPIDLLVPMTVATGKSIDEVMATFPKGCDSRKLAEAIYENLRANRNDYPLTILRSLMLELFSRELPSVRNGQDILLGAFAVLSDIESCIRSERRVEFLSHLLKDVRGRRVLVLDRGLPKSLKTPNVVIQPPVDAGTLGKLMGQSKLLAHCHPTYPLGLHERIINGMASGCVVVSDFAPCLEESFQNYRELIWTQSPLVLNDLFADYTDDHLKGIASNAYRQAWEAYSPANHMDIILETMGFTNSTPLEAALSSASVK